MTSPGAPVPPAVPSSVAVVLAAGHGTRMRSALPKVLHPMCGRTLLGHVLAAVEDLTPDRTLVVVGAGRAEVISTLPPHAQPVVQDEQLGTGHAVRVALDVLRADLDDQPAGTVLVVPGDAPLLRAATLAALLAEHERSGAAATLLTADVGDPAGYGRVLRDPAGRVLAVREDRDADDATRAIREVATSVYAFDAGQLRAALDQLGTDNAAGELYLTDAVGLLHTAGRVVSSVRSADPAEAMGVNDRVQLAAARRAMRDRLLTEAMLAGVTVTDPHSVWLGVRVRLAADATVHQNVQLHGTTLIEAGAVVGPDVTLTDTIVRSGARVQRAVCSGADIGPGADVGPFTHLRPGTVLGAGAKAGSFVEMKAAEVGAGSKVPHLSYVGDARIGERSNIGAATVFVNYDGRDKHRTEVGDDVRVGSDTAGSVITEDVPPGALGVARARQRNVEGWVARKRATGQASPHPPPTPPEGDRG
jgi:bifunctional UDP-N-acetylglucosamine pyrophosphorylase/glucosamine-1-phosphate N-acetyltransferase